MTFVISATFSNCGPFWTKETKIFFQWRELRVCTLIDHRQRPITERVVFNSLYKLNKFCRRRTLHYNVRGYRCKSAKSMCRMPLWFRLCVDNIHIRSSGAATCPCLLCRGCLKLSLSSVIDKKTHNKTSTTEMYNTILLKLKYSIVDYNIINMHYNILITYNSVLLVTICWLLLAVKRRS